MGAVSAGGHCTLPTKMPGAVKKKEPNACHRRNRGDMFEGIMKEAP